MHAHTQTQAPRAPADPHGQIASLLVRLLDVLERENADLRNNDLSRFSEYVRQKDVLLVDLYRAEKALGRAAGAPGAPAEKLREVQQALRENARLLDLHLGAAREFAGFLEESIRRRQSDGTYTRNPTRGYGKW